MFSTYKLFDLRTWANMPSEQKKFSENDLRSYETHTRMSYCKLGKGIDSLVVFENPHDTESINGKKAEFGNCVDKIKSCTSCHLDKTAAQAIKNSD